MNFLMDNFVCNSEVVCWLTIPHIECKKRIVKFPLPRQLYSLAPADSFSLVTEKKWNWQMGKSFKTSRKDPKHWTILAWGWIQFDINIYWLVSLEGYTIYTPDSPKEKYQISCVTLHHFSFWLKHAIFQIWGWIRFLRQYNVQFDHHVLRKSKSIIWLCMGRYVVVVFFSWILKKRR